MDDKGLVFSGRLREWHLKHPRDLPWKTDKNPYKIWLSEIILQQTRVAQGTPYYLKFVKAYPSISHLAKAKEDEVLKLWQGLGYYSRAKNLMKTAKVIVDKYDGQFPKHYKDILALPGIGPYTAAAISSFAYDQPYSVVDGNVIRVISRIFGVTEASDSKEGLNKISKITQAAMLHDEPADYNQAIMDFGATHCMPKQPLCDQCKMQSICYAYEHELQSQIPFKQKKLKKTKRFFHYLYIFDDDQLLIQKRTAKDIWSGLYQLPIIETDNNKEITFSSINQLMQQINPVYIPFKASQIYKQTLTHRYIEARFYKCYTKSLNHVDDQRFLLINKEDIGNFAFPRIVDLYLSQKSIPLFKS